MSILIGFGAIGALYLVFVCVCDRRVTKTFSFSENKYISLQRCIEVHICGAYFTPYTHCLHYVSKLLFISCNSVGCLVFYSTYKVLIILDLVLVFSFERFFFPFDLLLLFICELFSLFVAFLIGNAIYSFNWFHSLSYTFLSVSMQFLLRFLASTKSVYNLFENNSYLMNMLSKNKRVSGR